MAITSRYGSKLIISGPLIAHVPSLAHSYTSTDPNNSLNTFNVHHSIHNMAHEPETRAPEATPTTRPLASEPLSEPNFYGDAARRTSSPTRTATAVQGIPAAHAETHKQAHSAIATVLSEGAKMRPKRGPIWGGGHAALAALMAAHPAAAASPTALGTFSVSPLPASARAARSAVVPTCPFSPQGGVGWFKVQGARSPWCVKGDGIRTIDLEDVGRSPAARCTRTSVRCGGPPRRGEGPASRQLLSRPAFDSGDQTQGGASESRCACVRFAGVRSEGHRHG